MMMQHLRLQRKLQAESFSFKNTENVFKVLSWTFSNNTLVRKHTNK